MRYRVVLHTSDEGVDISVPGLPGCHSQGRTEAEAIDNIRSAIVEYLQVVDEQVRGSDVRQIDIII
jgi:predicted RNase H-like HicB family nuclease